MNHYSKKYIGNPMYNSFSKKEKLFVETGYYNTINKVNPNLVNKNFKNIIVFCGKGFTYTLCEQINYLAELTKQTDLFIGITDRNDLNGFNIHERIHLIPLLSKENEVPQGIFSENYFFCELKSIDYYIKKHDFSNYKFFTRLRKDIFLIIEDLLTYLQLVPSICKKYRYITTDQSTNLLRKFCLSDQFFTIPLESINLIPYRKIPENKNLFWWQIRHTQPHEIYKHNHQMEQWVWFHLLQSKNNNLASNCTYEEYLVYIQKNILVITSKQIGYIWNRYNYIYFHNWVRFTPNGNGLFSTTKPYRDFISYSSNLSTLLLQSKLVKYLGKKKILIFIRKFIKLIISLPIYYIKYLLK